MEECPCGMLTSLLKDSNNGLCFIFSLNIERTINLSLVFDYHNNEFLSKKERTTAQADPEKLQAARDAVLKGFKDAEAVFGGKLPDISYKTLDKLIEMIDAKISALGGSVVDLKA